MTQFKDAYGEYREKRPGSIIDFGLDWGPFLKGDTIADSTWDVPSGINKEDSPDEGKTDTTTSVWLSGGTEGREYVLTNTITTASGRVLFRPLRVKVVPLVSAEPEYFYNELYALRRAYAQGSLVVQYSTAAGPMRREYPSGEELLKRIAHLESKLYPEQPGSVRKRQVRFYTGKGF